MRDGRQALTDMARDGHRKGWWAVYEDVLPTGFDIYVGLEAEAAALRVFEDQVVHGLLQTEGYARIVMSAVRMQHTARQIDRAVELRIQRQEALTRDDPLKLWLILNEAVISRAVGGAEVMHAQLLHLIRASEWPSVTLQVLPLSSGAHPALNGPFCILEFPERTDTDVVYTEGVAGHAYLERDSDVRACAETFDLLRQHQAALCVAESNRALELVEAALRASLHTADDTRLHRSALVQEQRVERHGLRGDRAPARWPCGAPGLQGCKQASACLQPA